MKMKPEEGRGGSLIVRVFKRYYFVVMLTMLSMFACVVVDSAVTGQFLGKQAVTAMGIITPATALFQVVMGLFSSGGGQLCTRSMGKADLGRVNRIFSTLAICAGVVSALVSVALFAFAPAVARMLAPKAEAEVIGLAADYLRGYAFNLVPGAIAMNLNALMTLDNDQKRCLTYAVVILVADVALDLLNALVLHQGLFGMAMATSLSTFCGLVVLLLHFRQKDHLLRFSPGKLEPGCIGEALRIALAQNINLVVSSVFSYTLNNLLIHIGGGDLVASYAVCLSVYSMSTPFFMGVMLATEPIMSLSYGEEDKHALIQVLRASLQTMYRVGPAILILFFLLANPLSCFFLKSEHTNELYQAGRFVCFYAGMMAFSMLSNPVMGSLMGTGNTKLNILLSVLKEGVYPVACALSLGTMFGLTGVEIGLVLSGLLTLLTCFAIPWIKNRKFPSSVEGFLVLPEGFDAKPSELYEASMTTIDEVEKAAEAAEQFCLDRGGNPEMAEYVSLFIEEMAGDTVQYGFKDRQRGLIELRLVMKDSKHLIRLRDNGDRFDPVKWLELHKSTDPESGLGIRIIVGMAKEVVYFPAMGLNTLQVDLTKVEAA